MKEKSVIGLAVKPSMFVGSNNTVSLHQYLSKLVLSKHKLSSSPGNDINRNYSTL